MFLQLWLSCKQAKIDFEGKHLQCRIARKAASFVDTAYGKPLKMLGRQSMHGRVVNLIKDLF